jgi:hypothetical protein
MSPQPQVYLLEYAAAFAIQGKASAWLLQIHAALQTSPAAALDLLVEARADIQRSSAPGLPSTVTYGLLALFDRIRTDISPVCRAPAPTVPLTKQDDPHTGTNALLSHGVTLHASQADLNTKACHALITQHATLTGHAPSSAPKRVAKFNLGSAVLRHFTTTSHSYTVVATEDHILIYTDVSDTTLAALRQVAVAASRVTHCGDYGHVYAHPITRHVWWVGGDGDDPTTARDTLNLLGGGISVEAEHSPADKEGYINMGQLGIVREWED